MSNNPSNIEDESFTFKDVTIFYDYIFDLNIVVNPTDVVERLLQSDLAISSIDLRNKKIIVNPKIDYTTLQNEAFNEKEIESDMKAYSEPFLYEKPFTRIRLMPFYGLIDNEELDIDVSLFVYRTGIAIITFYVKYKNPKNIDQIITLTRSDLINVPNFKIVKAYLDKQPGQSIVNEENTYDYLGVRWKEYNNTNFHLNQILSIYATAIIQTVINKPFEDFNEFFVSLRYKAFRVYPILFLSDVSSNYDNLEVFIRKNSKELTGIITIDDLWKNLSDNDALNILASNLETSNLSRIFIKESHTTVIFNDTCYTREKSPYGKKWPIWTYFYVSRVIDIICSISYTMHIIRIKKSDLDKIGPNKKLKKLNNIKSEMLQCLLEYYNMNHIFHTGYKKELMEKGLEAHGIKEYHEQIEFSLEIVEKSIEIEESKRRENEGIRQFNQNMSLQIIIIVLTVTTFLSGLFSIGALPESITNIVSKFDLVLLYIALFIITGIIAAFYYYFFVKKTK